MNRGVANLIGGAFLGCRQQERRIKRQWHADRPPILQLEGQPLGGDAHRRDIWRRSVIQFHPKPSIIWFHAVVKSARFPEVPLREIPCSNSTAPARSRTLPRRRFCEHEHGPVHQVPNCKIQCDTLSLAKSSALWNIKPCSFR